MMIEGKSVYSGVAIGRLAIYHKADNQVKREKISDKFVFRDSLLLFFLQWNRQ